MQKNILRLWQKDRRNIQWKVYWCRLLTNNNDKPAVELWEELADYDGVFYEEFTRVITNADIPEADDTFDTEYFDDKYLNI